jgi:hypothetical protein
MPNTELLSRTLERIKTSPHQWIQDNWITLAGDRVDPGCGTAYCYAGWAVVLSGYEIGSDALVELDQLPPEITNRLTARGIRMFGAPRKVAVPEVAAILLDIPRWDGCTDHSHHLFCGGNDLERLEQLVADMSRPDSEGWA